MDINSKIAIFEEKIEEYYFSCFPRGMQLTPDREHLHEYPVVRFNIQAIYKTIAARKIIPETLLEKCADKLIDIKLIYCYLETTLQHFYRGNTLIVGKNEIEKLNPKTISILRGNHYKVYLISVIIEDILDFFELVFHGRESNYKKKKWEKILAYISGKEVIDSLNDENITTLLAFKEKYRTAEFHKFSAVRAFTSKEEWDHFDKEKNIIRNIISDISSYFTKGEVE